MSCHSPYLQPTIGQSWTGGEIATNQSQVFLYFHQTQLTADPGEIEDFEILKYEIREDQHWDTGCNGEISTQYAES